MPRFAITAALTTPEDSALSRVTDLVLGPGDILYGTTRFDGRITSWDIGGPLPVQVATSGFDSGVIAGNQPARRRMAQPVSMQACWAGLAWCI